MLLRQAGFVSVPGSRRSLCEEPGHRAWFVTSPCIHAGPLVHAAALVASSWLRIDVDHVRATSEIRCA